MSETMQLLRLFRVEKQLRGLKSRLTGAERFLKQQQTQHEELAQRAGAIAGQLRQIRASIANEEGEVERIDARMATMREQMNQAKTAKEYNAFLSELNNYKKQKSDIETGMLESMTKADALENELKQLEVLRDERGKIVDRAKADRDEREGEIKGRVEELTKQREEVAAEVPPASRNLLNELLSRVGDEAMAPVEVLDRRNLEYSCSACMMTLPIEAVNSMLSGRITQCTACESILYTEEDLLSRKSDRAVAKA